MRILVIEFDHPLRSHLCESLSGSDFILERAPDWDSVSTWPLTEDFAAVVLDVGQAQTESLNLIRKWRKCGVSTPILMLSSLANHEEGVEGLAAGADDHVSKLARSEEILARLCALIRRASGFTANRLTIGAVSLEMTTRTGWLGCKALELTQMEYRLLRIFMLSAGHILSQTEILDQLYPMEAERDMNTIEVHVGRLRRKIGHTCITTIRGLGYRFECGARGRMECAATLQETIGPVPTMHLPTLQGAPWRDRTTVHAA